METPVILPVLGDIYRWAVGKGWSTPISIGPLTDHDTDTCVIKSDTHPDMIADLVAEYLTDTIVRIDSQAHVDLSVVVKQDLIVVTGQVACSHPAKGAIIHSDQYLGTLNASIRDFLKEVGFVTVPATSSQISTTPTTPPQNPNSPKKQASTSINGVGATGPTTGASSVQQPTSPNGTVISLEEDDPMDPSQIHVILAITQGGTEELPSTVICSAKASPVISEAYSVGRRIEEAISQYRKTSANIYVNGGIVVEIECSSDRFPAITVSFQAKLGSDRLLSDLGESVLGSDFLLSLSPRITSDTVITIRNVNRANSTGVSAVFCGKDWKNPLRYGHVLANQEANRLSSSNTVNLVELKFSAVPGNALVGVRVLSRDSQQDSLTVSRSIFERLLTKKVEEVRDSVFIDPSSSFLTFNSCGSSCSTESLSRF